MARIPRDIVDVLTRKLNELSEISRKAISDQVSTIRFDGIADLREQLIEILEPYFGNAADMAAVYALDMYEDAREYALGSRLGAIPDAGRDPAATAQAIRYFVGKVEDQGIDGVLRLLQERMDYEIKKAAGQAAANAAIKDPEDVKFARVPSGAETCEFCLMLASRGFVYGSKANAGALDHWHPHCDCRIVPGFKGFTEVEGYNPDALYDKWKESGFNPNAPKQRRTKYTYESTDDDIPSFQNFNDVKQYLSDSTSQEDLEHRLSILGNIYGFNSEQMKSQALRNVLKTASHKFE